MNYLADSTAKLCQGGKGRYVGREGVPVDNCSREPVVVFESLDLSVCRRYEQGNLLNFHVTITCSFDLLDQIHKMCA